MLKTLALPKIPALPFKIILSVFVTLFVSCHKLWATQEAIVMVPQAVVYADMKQSSPIGFIPRGKKILIGERSRNRGEVYPTVVSGKIAYVRVLDVSTEVDSLDPDRLVSERFFRVAKKNHMRRNYTFSYLTFASQLGNVGTGNRLKNNDPLAWSGASFKGEILASEKLEALVLINYLSATADTEEFRLVETGMGVGYRVLELGRLLVKLDALFLAIPFANYSFGEYFRVNGRGGSIGAGVSASYRLGSNFGLEVTGGPYYTMLSGFNVPRPAQRISPNFLGTRFGLGLNYRY